MDANSLTRKIIAPERLAQTLRTLRAAGKQVVHCHGCFDIVHPGHVRYLQSARQLGDILVVSITSDAGVEKGPDRPYIPQELRAENLAALEFVDWVVVDPHPTACELIETLRPDVYVKGREYAHASDTRFLRERDAVEKHGGRVVFHSGDVVFSSTRLIENLSASEHLDECRLRTACQRGGVNVESIRDILDRISGLRVVVVGDLMSERYVFCDTDAVATRAPMMSLQQLGQQEFWGGAAAVAVQVRALGAQPTLISAVGADEESERVMDDFVALGVNSHFLRVRPNTVRRSTMVADDTKLFELNEGAFAPLDSAAEREAWDAVAGQLANADLVLWCDYGYGFVTPGLIQAMLAVAPDARPVIAGHAPNQRGQLNALLETDLLVATERRLREASTDMSIGLSSAAWQVLNETRGQAAIVTLRKRGVIGFDGRRPHGASVGPPERLKSDFVPALTNHVTDLLGADEALLAAASLTIAAGGGMGMATYLGAAAEAVCVSRLGGRLASRDELHAFLSRRPEMWPESRFVPNAQPIWTPQTRIDASPPAETQLTEAP